MANFISNFINQYVKGTIDDDALCGIQSTASVMLEKLYQVKTKLFNVEQEYAEVIPALLYNTDLPAVNVRNIITDDSTEYVVTVAYDVIDKILSSFDNVYKHHENLSNIVYPYTYNISDRLGQVYSLYMNGPNVTINVDGETVSPYCSFKGINSISSLDELFIYKINDEFKINYRFIPFNLSTVPVRIPIETVIEGIETISDIYNPGYVFDNEFNIYDWSLDTCKKLGIASVHVVVSKNIEERLKPIFKHIGLDYNSSLSMVANFQSLIDHITGNEVSDDICPRFGVDVLHELALSDTINNVLDDAIVALTSNRFNVADFISSCKSKYTDASLEIKNVWNGISTSYSNGGVYAAAKYIIDYFQGAQSITFDSGVLVLTNNKDLIPSVYLSGLVAGIMDSISSVAAYIALTYSVILGPLVSAASFIVGSIVKAMDYDYAEQTLCRVFPYKELLTLPCAPFSLAQGSIPLSTAEKTNSQLYKTMIAAKGIYYCEIPGSIILFSLTEDNEGIIYDVHPTLAQYGDVNDIYPYDEKLIVKTVDAQDPGMKLDLYTLYHVYKNSYLTFNYAKIMNIFKTRRPIEDIQYDGNGLTNEKYDNIVRSWVMKSIALTYCYAYFNTNRNTNIVLNIPELPVVQKVGKYYTLDPDNKTWTYYKLSSATYQNPLYSDIRRDLFLLLLESSEYHYTNGSNSTFIGCNTVTTSSWRDVISGCDNTITYKNIMYSIPNITEASATGSPIISWNSAEFYKLPMTDVMFVSRILTDRNYINDAMMLTCNYDFMIQVPKYDRSSFIPSVLFTYLAATTTAVVGCAIGFGVRRAILNKRMINAAKVEDAWNRSVENPTPENLRAYRHEARVANLWQKLIGGTKYSTSNYWNSDLSGQLIPSLGEYVSSLSSDANTMRNEHSTDTDDDNLINNDSLLLLKYIISIINGETLT